ncbi:hypothetical protein SLEP1_g13402 [Rubroshorea leprosula]|uniref:Uncharacterized protein n=1 Tax=Rubroshorea leprosula TaxID=152421 RepID=A0AAV5ILG9_9ROSI|nr:hypothetical protein SLEP1_g13402 [Rubroshorea leprosula]
MAGIGWLAQSGIRTGRIVRRGGQSWLVNWQNKAGDLALPRRFG